MANKELGLKLRELRNKSKMTQQEVSDLIGLKNKSTLGSWEVGKSEPDAMTFLKLCQIYEIEDILFEFTGKSTTKTIDPTYELIKELDEIDKAEIRGEVKQMLKADKYKRTISDDISDTITAAQQAFSKVTDIK